MNPTKLIFCTSDLVETEHSLQIDQNNEILATCPCGRFIKFPAGLTPEEFSQQVSDYKTNNEEQSKVRSQQQKDAEASQALLTSFADTAVQPVEQVSEVVPQATYQPEYVTEIQPETITTEEIPPQDVVQG